MGLNMVSPPPRAVLLANLEKILTTQGHACNVYALLVTIVPLVQLAQLKNNVVLLVFIALLVLLSHLLWIWATTLLAR
jgi:hypothetical protein